MPRPYIPGGFNFIGTIVIDVLAGLVFIIGFAVVVGLIVVLVRFLLVATKAAQLYLDNNAKPKNGSILHVEPAPVPSTRTESADTTPTVPVGAPPAKPRTARTPKKN